MATNHWSSLKTELQSNCLEIIVPTEKGAVYPHKFVCSMDMAVTNIKIGMKVIVNTLHTLLGYRNEDSICKIACEF